MSDAAHAVIEDFFDQFKKALGVDRINFSGLMMGIRRIVKAKRIEATIVTPFAGKQNSFSAEARTAGFKLCGVGNKSSADALIAALHVAMSTDPKKVIVFAQSADITPKLRSLAQSGIEVHLLTINSPGTCSLKNCQFDLEALMVAGIHVHDIAALGPSLGVQPTVRADYSEVLVRFQSNNPCDHRDFAAELKKLQDQFRGKLTVTPRH